MDIYTRIPAPITQDSNIKTDINKKGKAMNHIMQFLRATKTLYKKANACFKWQSESPTTLYYKNVKLWKDFLKILNAYLCSIGRFIYGFISYEKVQIINAFHYPPLSLVTYFG